MKKRLLLIILIFLATWALLTRAAWLNRAATPTPEIPSLITGTPISSYSSPTLQSRTTRTAGFCGDSGFARHFEKYEELENGLIRYSMDSTHGILTYDTVRTLTMSKEGLFIGFIPLGDPPPQVPTVSFFDGWGWESCWTFGGPIPFGTINGIGITPLGEIVVATDGNGVYVFDGDIWHQFTTENGLPDNRGYGVTIMEEGIFIPTWEGTARFDGNSWSVPEEFTNPLPPRHYHVIEFYNNDVLLGHISDGLSWWTIGDGWRHYKTESHPEALGSNNVRDILVDSDFNIWVATDPGPENPEAPGVSVFDRQTGEWKLYPIPRAVTLTLDPSGRVWVGGYFGAFYQENGQWVKYADVVTFAIAFGCKGCIWDEKVVFLGAPAQGLFRGQVPVP